MDGQRAGRVASIDRVPSIEKRPGPARPERRPSLPADLAPHRELTIGWAAVLGIGWPLVVAASLALEPAPANPEAPVPLAVELAGLALFVALITTVVAAGIRRRAAAVTGAAFGVGSLAFAVLCPVTGHHALGLWWFGEVGLVAGMLGLSLAALGRRARVGA